MDDLGSKRLFRFQYAFISSSSVLIRLFFCRMGNMAVYIGSCKHEVIAAR